MSAILVPNFFDLQDGFNKSHRHAHLTSGLEESRKGRSRHLAVAAATATGCSPAPPSPSLAPKSPSSSLFAMPHKASNGSSLSLLLPLQQQHSREHRKLDRSMSEPVTQPQVVQRTVSSSGSSSSASSSSSVVGAGSGQANSSRYKTELCRPFEENGTCKYGDKCQFAHGGQELRTLARHPKYKTELCRTFHTTGFCPYGPRCHFIHNSEESKKTLLTSLRSSPDGSEPGVPSSGGRGPNPTPVPRPKALSVGSFSLGSAGELSPPSSLSASPTSLHSFFSDDLFYCQALGPQSSGAGPQQACTAFSFSQDFAGALCKAPGLGGAFGGSQPSLGSGLRLAEVQDRDPFLFDSPPSPVDSLGSELEGLSLAATAGPNSPVSCASPLALLGPRLPIFSRLATSDSE